MAFTENDIPDLSGKVALITGATGGLGFEMARMLAGARARVILAGRNPGKGADALQRVLSIVPEANVSFEQVDLGRLASIREFAARMSLFGNPIDILINNAGVMMPPTRQTTDDGYELQFGTNHLGPYALTGLLLPQLASAERPRVVAISSNAARTGRIYFDDLQFVEQYRPMAAYGQSKLANLLFMRKLQQLSDEHGWNLVSVAAHPGYARTDLIRNGPGELKGLMRMAGILFETFASNDAAGGALPAILAATESGVRPLDYFGPSQFMGHKGPPGLARLPERAQDDGVAHRLWQVSAELTGVNFPGHAA